MNSLHERLKEERIRLELNQDEFASKAGLKRRAQVHYESGERSPDGHYYAAIAAIGADVQYILTGIPSINLRNDLRNTKEQLYLVKTTTETAASFGLPDNQAHNLQSILFAVGRRDAPGVVEAMDGYENSVLVHQRISASNQADYAEIPHYNVQAAAGGGVLNSSEEQLRPLAFRRDWLAKRHLSPTNLVIVDVKGESMEPKLQNGDLVLVDKSQTGIASGKTYVLRMDGHLLVKNLQLLPHGQIQVASFNSGFPPYQVDLSDESLDMAVIGRVVASMHEW